MEELRMEIWNKLECADGELRNLCTVLQMMASAFGEAYANGEEMAEVLEHVRDSIGSVRAVLDDATDAVRRMKSAAA
ncbi:MAG: hypothetical protein J5602_00470 [Clostridia bacterium]|nr:hypothetical protein [Clostridia bacterium]